MLGPPVTMGGGNVKGDPAVGLGGANWEGVIIRRVFELSAGFLGTHAQVTMPCAVRKLA